MPTKKTIYDFDVTVSGMPTLADVGQEKAMQAGMQAGDAKPASAKPSPSGSPDKQSMGNQKSPGSSKAGTPEKTVEPKPEGEKNDKGKGQKKKNKNKKHASSSSSSPSSSSSSDSSSSDSSDGEDLRRSRGVRRALESWRYPLYSPSASYRQLDTVTGSHQYTISGYSLARAMGCGTRLCSDLFEVAGQMFRVEVYPAGFTADSRKHTSVFLTTPGAISPNHVLFEIAILDQSGKDKHIVATSSDAGRPHRHHGPMLSHSRGVVAAVLRLAKSKALEEKRKRYLPHDMLVLRATVHVLRGWSSVPTVHGHMTSSTLHPQHATPMGMHGSLGVGCHMGSTHVMPSMQGLAMPGFGLGPSTLHPVKFMPTVSPTVSPTGVYGSLGMGSPLNGMHQQQQQQPGVVHLAPYAVPGAQWPYAPAPHVPGPAQWVATPSLYDYGAVPLA